MSVLEFILRLFFMMLEKIIVAVAIQFFLGEFYVQFCLMVIICMVISEIGRTIKKMLRPRE